MSRAIILVDIDGTLADVRHRLRHIQGPGRKNWKRFFAEMHKDVLIGQVAEFVRKAAAESEIVIFTGRPDDYREATEEWLRKQEIPYERLLMRRRGDHRPDYVVKEELLGELEVERIALALDDRPPVREMLERRGIRCPVIESDVENQQVNFAYQERP